MKARQEIVRGRGVGPWPVIARKSVGWSYSNANTERNNVCMAVHVDLSMVILDHSNLIRRKGNKESRNHQLMNLYTIRYTPNPSEHPEDALK